LILTMMPSAGRRKSVKKRMKDDIIKLGPGETGTVRAATARSTPDRFPAVANLTAEAFDGHMLVARSLKKLGVTHAYCVSGTPVRETFADCLKAGIRPIGVRNQQAGVMMAVAQNYIDGGVTAVSLLSAGPAITNAATSVLVAHDNCWPVVILGGRRPLSMQQMGSFQELNAVEIFQSITKWSALVPAVESIPQYLDRAFQTALSGRPGPVYLDIPEDVLTGIVCSAELPLPKPVEYPPPDNAAIAQAAKILLQATRPAIILGKGIRWSQPCMELERLVEDFGIPFMTSPMGRGYLPDDHPLCFNHSVGLLQSMADAVLLVGARLNWTFRFGCELADDVKLIQIDIHEPEIGVNKSPSVGIVGDTKEVLQRLLAHMKVNGDTCPKNEISSWHAVLDRERARKKRKLDAEINNSSIPMSPYRMLKEIRDFLPRDAICAFDGNVFMAAAQQIFPSYRPASRFTAGTNGCMGVGIPFGIGAKLSQPHRLVMVICGDTAFGFNAMEMETAVRHKIPVIIVVVNNDGNCGALAQQALFSDAQERITMFQPDIRYESMMQAFGGHGEYVETPEQLRPALERAVSTGLPACINVKVDPNAPYPH
jgi:thiamine pyrophosphate-dependent acetolactate synthase large subunit-like protein